MQRLVYNQAQYFRKNIKGHTITILDIDECREDSDGCAQNCANTVGSYTCGCNTGYDLAPDGLSCTGKTLAHNYGTSRLIIIL